MLCGSRPPHIRTVSPCDTTDIRHPKSVFVGSLCGMVFSMATTKITITLQNDQVEAIRALVAAGKSANVSAFVQHAVRVALFDAEGWREMLEDALQQTGGPL